MLVASHDTCGIILIVKVPSAVRIDEKSVGIIHEIDGRAKVYPRSIGASIVAWYWGISRNTRREECARLCNSMACKANGNQSNDHRKHLEISRSSLDFRRKMAGSSHELAFNSSLGNSSVLLDYSTVPSGALYFEANITNLSPSTATPSTTLNFTFSSSVSGEFVTGGTSVNGDTWLDRGHTNAFDNPYFSDKFSASGLYSGAENGSWTISGVIDRSILEVFVNGAEQSGTMTFYSTRPLDVMRLGAAGVAANATVSVGVWALEDAWAAQADGNGTVLGNVTTGGGSGGMRLF